MANIKNLQMWDSICTDAPDFGGFNISGGTTCLKPR